MRTPLAFCLLTLLAAPAFAHCGGPPTTVVTDRLEPFMPPAPDVVQLDRKSTQIRKNREKRRGNKGDFSRR